MKKTSQTKPQKSLEGDIKAILDKQISLENMTDNQLFTLQNEIRDLHFEATKNHDTEKMMSLNKVMEMIQKYLENNSRSGRGNSVFLTPKERQRINNVIDCLLGDSEIDSIKPKAIPKLLFCLNERYEEALRSFDVDTSNKLLQQIEKIRDIEARMDADLEKGENNRLDEQVHDSSGYKSSKHSEVRRFGKPPDSIQSGDNETNSCASNSDSVKGKKVPKQDDSMANDEELAEMRSEVLSGSSSFVFEGKQNSIVSNSSEKDMYKSSYRDHNLNVGVAKSQPKFEREQKSSKIPVYSSTSKKSENDTKREKLFEELRKKRANVQKVKSAFRETLKQLINEKEAEQIDTFVDIENQLNEKSEIEWPESETKWEQIENELRQQYLYQLKQATDEVNEVCNEIKANNLPIPPDNSNEFSSISNGEPLSALSTQNLILDFENQPSDNKISPPDIDDIDPNNEDERLILNGVEEEDTINFQDNQSATGQYSDKSHRGPKPIETTKQTSYSSGSEDQPVTNVNHDKSNDNKKGKSLYRNRINSTDNTATSSSTYRNRALSSDDNLHAISPKSLADRAKVQKGSLNPISDDTDDDVYPMKKESPRKETKSSGSMKSPEERAIRSPSSGKKRSPTISILGLPDLHSDLDLDMSSSFNDTSSSGGSDDNEYINDKKLKEKKTKLNPSKVNPILHREHNEASRHAIPIDANNPNLEITSSDFSEPIVNAHKKKLATANHENNKGGNYNPTYNKKYSDPPGSKKSPGKDSASSSSSKKNATSPDFSKLATSYNKRSVLGSPSAAEGSPQKRKIDNIKDAESPKLNNGFDSSRRLSQGSARDSPNYDSAQSDQLAKSVSQMKEMLQNSMNEFNILKRDCEATMEEYTVIKEELDQCQQQILKYRQEVAAARQEALDAKQEAVNFKQEAVDAKEFARKTRSEFDSLKEMLNATKEENVLLKQENAKLQQEVSTIKTDLDNIRKEINPSKQESTSVKDDILNIIQDVNQIKSDINDLREHDSENRNDINDMKSVLEDHTASLDSFKSDNITITKDIGTIKTDFAQMKKDTTKISETNAKIKSTQKEIKKEYKVIKGKYEKSEKENIQIRSQLASIQSSVDGLLQFHGDKSASDTRDFDEDSVTEEKTNKQDSTPKGENK